MGDLASMAAAVAAVLVERGETVAVSESSTGGLVSAALLAIPGASAFYRGGGVVYTVPARIALLGIPKAEVAGMRGATEAYALLCARTVRDRLGAIWGLAESGASGPTGNRYGDAAGHTCFAVAGPREAARTLETGRADREENMWAFTRATLDLLDETVRAEAAG